MTSIKNLLSATVAMVVGSHAPVVCAADAVRWPPPNLQDAQCLGSCWIDGNLKMYFDLGTVDLDNGLRLPVQLVHDLQVSSECKARSGWWITGFRTFLVPAERTRLTWTTPRGVQIEIDREIIKATYTLIRTTGWAIRELRPGDWDLRDVEGRVWSYRKGALKRISSEHGLSVRVETHGGLVDGYYSEHEGALVPIATAAYDPYGRVLSVVIGTVTHRFRYEDESSAVAEWATELPGNCGGTTSLKYKDGVLTSVQGMDGSRYWFRWAEIGTPKRRDQIWSLPVQVVEDQSYFYSHQLCREGFVLIARPKTGDPEEELIFNPQVGRVIRRRGGGTLEVLEFSVDKQHSSSQRVTKIKDGSGAVVQRFVYGEGGRLERIDFPGQTGSPPILVSYDLRGQVSAITRGGNPWNPYEQR